MRVTSMVKTLGGLRVFMTMSFPLVGCAGGPTLPSASGQKEISTNYLIGPESAEYFRAAKPRNFHHGACEA